MRRILITCILLTAVGLSNAQVQGNVYDGSWTGKATCSGSQLPDTRRPEGYTDSFSIFISDRKGTVNADNADYINRFVMHIDDDLSVHLQNNGARRENTNKNWAIDAYGKLNGDTILVLGAMTTDGGNKIVRDRCEFKLRNSQVQARLDEYKRPSPVVVVEASSRPDTKMVSATATVKADPILTRPPAPAPQIVAASPQRPARLAAIGNVSPSSGGENKFSKVTSNPVDAIKKTSGNDVWINLNPSISVQERQFCRIVENYRAESKAAEATRNQIKVNETSKAFSQAINALLPDGNFQGWVMRSVSVAQASDGSADVLFELPCNVYVGSNTCDSNPRNFYGTVAENSRIYSELAKVTVSDFALVSGKFVYPDDKAFERNRSVVSYGYLKTGVHCKSKNMAAGSDFFGTNISVLSTIK